MTINLNKPVELLCDDKWVLTKYCEPSEMFPGSYYCLWWDGKTYLMNASVHPERLRNVEESTNTAIPPEQKERLKYQISVMKAYEQGKKIEVSYHLKEWVIDKEPKFMWGVHDYRIAESELAKGHNPHGLTVEQIGEGWRLLEEDEVEVERTFVIQGIEAWGSRAWLPYHLCGNNTANTYRTKLTREQLAELAKPKTRAWTENDTPSFFYIRPISGHGAFLVQSVTKYGVDSFGSDITFDWEQLREQYEYSTDRKVWQKCEVVE